MIIHFFWTDDFPPLNGKGINLSAEYFMRLDVQKESADRVQYRLHINKNPEYLTGFWGNNNIDAVSAIIGKNGAGKTSILRYIMSRFPEGLEANIHNDLVAYSVTGEETRNYIVYPGNWDLEVVGEAGHFEMVPYTNFPETANDFRYVAHLTQADYIFYSFMLDYGPQVFDWHGLKNISTAGLMAADRKRLFEEAMKGASANDTSILIESDVDRMVSQEFGMATQFIISEFKSLLPFPLPKSIAIKIVQEDRAFFKNPDNGSSDVQEIIGKLEDWNKDASIEERPLNSLLIALYVNYMLTERKYSGGMTFKHNTELNYKETPYSFVTRFFGNLANDLYVDGSKEYPIARNKALSLKIPEFIALVKVVLASGDLLAIDGEADFNFVITQEGIEKFEQLMKSYMEVKGITNFLSFNWPSLSTGQQSFLSLVSRFLHMKRHEIGSDSLKRDLVILIDEGDAGFHPEWQRQFFKKALAFLSLLFNDHRLQLIFTANAPFLTSDMPRYCVTFIEKTDDGGWIIHDKENNREETFGSNIHTLLSNGFYMEGALIGDFAREKINDLIKRIYAADGIYLDDNLREDKKLIALIGEPVLRRKLELMWSDKFGLLEEEELLRKRLREIEEEKEIKSKKK
jgi:hypothetical protein